MSNTVKYNNEKVYFTYKKLITNLFRISISDMGKGQV